MRVERDFRPPEEYAQGHIAGAPNIPLDKLRRRLKVLPRDWEVVAYCRGPWGVLSYEAVARLRKAGIDARCLKDGLPEWRRAGRGCRSNTAEALAVVSLRFPIRAIDCTGWSMHPNLIALGGGVRISFAQA